MPPETRSSNTSIEITTFLKSEEFALILKNIVNNKIQTLNEKIEELQTKVTDLKESNIQLIHLLTNVNQEKESFPVQGIYENNCENNLLPQQAINKNPQKHKTKALKLSSLSSPIPKFAEPVKDCHTLRNEDQAEWTYPKRRFRARRSAVIYGKGRGTNDFKGVTKYIDYHVSRLPPNLNENDVVKYLNGKNITDIKCSKMVSKYPDEYASFKISVCLKQDKEFRNPDIWPEFCVVNRFLVNLPNRRQSRT